MAHHSGDFEPLRGAYLLTGSNAIHKARLATRSMGVHVVPARVLRNEPNDLWQTDGLITQKRADFSQYWVPPEDFRNGRKAAGSADVNVGHQVQGDSAFIPSRKIPVNGKNLDQKLDALATAVSFNATRLGKGKTIVSRIEAGASFERVFNKRSVEVVAVTRTHVTQVDNPMADRKLFLDYLHFSGLGEMHLGMPWGMDWLSWVAFLIIVGRNEGMKADEMVRLPKLMSDRVVNKEVDFQIYEELGRYRQEWITDDKGIDRVDATIALGLLEMGTNFPKAMGTAITGALNVPGVSRRTIYIH